jgi:hypothetical protein
MGRIRRGGYVFLTWKGDHQPKHVHVYRDGRPLAKWDRENHKVMEGAITGKLRKLIKAS